MTLPKKVRSPEDKKRMEDFLKCVNETHIHAKKQGLKKGKGGNGSLSCPKCKIGTISYSVSSYNGHIWGHCSTEGCVAWME